MKSKAVLFVLLVLVSAFCFWGCGGGGGSSNPVAPAQTLTNVTVQIINSTDKKPVEGATVVLTSCSNALAEELINKNVNVSARMAVANMQNKYSGITDSMGNCTIRNIPVGKYTLIASKNGMAQISQNIDITSSSNTITDVNLVPTGKITGKVSYNEKEKGIPSAIVYLENTSLNSVTDSDGNYSIEGVPVNQSFNLKVIHSAGIFSLNEEVVIDTKATDFELVRNIIITDGSSKGANVAITLSGSNLPFKKYIIVGFGTNGNSAIAVFNKIEESNKALYNSVIYQPDTYTFVPVCCDNSISPLPLVAASNTVTVSASHISSSESIEGPKFDLYGNSYELIDMVVNLPVNAEADYEVTLYNESSGSERKAVIAKGKTSCIFYGLPTTTNVEYSVAAVSEEKLAVIRNLRVFEKIERIASFTLPNPVGVIPTFDQNEGYITVRRESPENHKDNTATREVSVSFFAKSSDDNLIKLYKYEENKITDETILFDAFISNGINLSTDNCGDGEYELVAVYSFSSNNNQTSFKREFIAKNKMIPRRKIIELKGINASNASDEIIFFDVVANGTEDRFVVATKKNLYCFDASGSQIISPQELTTEISPNCLKGRMVASEYRLYYQYLTKQENDNGNQLTIGYYSFSGDSFSHGSDASTTLSLDEKKKDTLTDLYIKSNGIVTSLVNGRCPYYVNNGKFDNTNLNLEPSIIAPSCYFINNGDNFIIQYLYVKSENNCNYVYLGKSGIDYQNNYFVMDNSNPASYNLGADSFSGLTNDGCFSNGHTYADARFKIIPCDSMTVIDFGYSEQNNYLVCDDSNVYMSSRLQIDKIQLNSEWYVERNADGQFVCCKSPSGAGKTVAKYKFNQIANSKSFLSGSLRKSAVSSSTQVFYIGLSDNASDTVTITKINLK